MYTQVENCLIPVLEDDAVSDFLLSADQWVILVPVDTVIYYKCKSYVTNKVKLSCKNLLPFGNVLGNIAHLADGVEDLAEIAVLLAGSNSVQADVELLAIGRVGVPRVGLLDGLSGIQFGAGETVIQNCVDETN